MSGFEFNIDELNEYYNNFQKEKNCHFKGGFNHDGTGFSYDKPFHPTPDQRISKTIEEFGVIFNQVRKVFVFHFNGESKEVPFATIEMICDRDRFDINCDTLEKIEILSNRHFIESLAIIEKNNVFVENAVFE